MSLYKKISKDYNFGFLLIFFSNYLLGSFTEETH